MVGSLLGPADALLKRSNTVERKPTDSAPRQQRQFDQLVAYTQKLWRDSEAVRKEFWKKADASSPEKWEQSCEWYRDYFWKEVIGKLPEPTVPMNPRSRQVYDEKSWTGYEVMLDLFPDVFAEGILLLPKGMKPDEKRPVVVCQHGLEGTPRSCIDPEPRPTYDQFARKLVEKGYIVYCPQNPYKFENHFRQIQRKANPLKLSLFSFIIAQHRRTIDWLETLPNVDPKRIAFYGLSYGGKTAMRVPAVEKRYCLSICSGDFNEWIGKCVSVDLDRSYMWTREYDMYEFDLGNTFNYAEMAYLIAPRPFMVERGHDDGVGTDEMVAYEYAKVRYLYAYKLNIPDRTAIEFFPGYHRINGKGTFEFLQKHLHYP
ncbi:MAG TPA: dienelactone hydrolase family protein [Fimbriiglobus sp.]